MPTLTPITGASNADGVGKNHRDLSQYLALFLSRVSTLKSDIDIAILSVCPSVRLSVTFRN